MQKNKIIIGLIAVAVLSIGIFGYLAFAPKQAPSTSSFKVPEPQGTPAITVVRTNDGYKPDTFTIKKGDIVLWTNESDEYHWPASDLHPTHGIYPEFDPLRPIAPGDTWKFKFDKVGTWKFHDHIRANIVGTITVTE